MTDPEKIALLLSEYEAEILLATSNGWTHYMPISPRTQARNRLAKEGLVEKARHSGLDAWRRTDLGRAVAAALRPAPESAEAKSLR